MYKKIVFLISVISCLASNCNPQGTHTSISTTKDNGHTSLTIEDDDVTFSFSFSSGEIAFSDDEKSILSFPADGILKFRKDGKKLVITSDASGKILYGINGDEKKEILSEEDKKLVAGAIRVMIENGVGAKDRAGRLYKTGGTRAVLEETGHLKSDYVKSIYLQYLLSIDNLSAADMAGIANLAQTSIGSDYEKGKLLGSFTSRYLGNAVTAKAFLDAVKSIHSDYEKAKAVKTILNQQLTDEQFTSVLDIANTINSDYEKAGVLTQVISGNKISSSKFKALLDAVSKISADYERATVLKKVFETAATVPDNVFLQTLNVISSIGSDYEKAGVLRKIAEAGIGTDENWKSLIKETAKIGADYEKGETLRFIATKMPDSAAVKEAYLQSAKTIGADYEYGKTIRALK